MTRSWQGMANFSRVLIVLHDLVMVVVTWLALRWLAGQAGAPPAMSIANEIAFARDADIDGRIRDMQTRSASKAVVFPTPFTPTMRLKPG